MFHKLEFSKHKNNNIFTSCFGFLYFTNLSFRNTKTTTPLGDSNEVDLLIANSDAKHQEGVVNYRVGGAKQRDVWDKIPTWEIEVGHIGVFRNDNNASSPWFLGRVLQVIEDGLHVHGIAGETLIIHEMGNEKRSSGISDPVSLTTSSRSGNEGNFNYNGKHYYRYQEQTRRNGIQDVFKKKIVDSVKLMVVRSAHDRSTLAYWGPQDKILKVGMSIRKDVLLELDKNPNVNWKMPEITKKSKKRK